MVTWSSSLIGHCSAATILNLKWHHYYYQYYIHRYAWEQLLWPQLREDFPVCLLFQQGGAQPHFHLAVRVFLNNQLPKSWTGCGELPSWPPDTQTCHLLTSFSGFHQRLHLQTTNATVLARAIRLDLRCGCSSWCSYAIAHMGRISVSSRHLLCNWWCANWTHVNNIRSVSLHVPSYLIVVTALVH
jgi:hypothetical protein